MIKLETDDTLLIPKARAALERYGHQVVIGNDLNKRKYEVVFVSHNAGQFVENWLRIDPNPPASPALKEIEEDIVMELVLRHDIWIHNQAQGTS